MKIGFLIYLILALFLGIAFWVSMMVLNIEVQNVIFFIPIYFAIVGLVFEALLKKTEDANKFVINYMGLSGGKMFLSLLILFGCIYLNPAYIWPFGICFLVGYFTFTALEIIRLHNYLKK